MLKPGDSAPRFELTDQAGHTVRLADLLAQGPVVVYFYPADFTPICTSQACMFRDRSDELAAAGVRVVGISSGSSRRHGRFAAKHHLPFTLLADPGRRVARRYGATAVFGLVPRRVSYYIGPDGRVIAAARADLSVAGHSDLVDRILADRRAGP
jgi:peroxiredoxin Q/BCP